MLIGYLLHLSSNEILAANIRLTNQMHPWAEARDYCGFRFLLASALYSVHDIHENSVDILTACILGMLLTIV